MYTQTLLFGIGIENDSIKAYFIFLYLLIMVFLNVITGAVSVLSLG
jgi:hypothetical protein